MRTIACILLLILQGAPALAAPGTVTPDPLQQLQEDINHAVSLVRPALVHVKARKKAAAPGGVFQWTDSIGSGVVVDEKGYILTNNHVVDNAADISVTLWRPAPNRYTATLIKKDPAMDLALIHIQGAGNLAPARFVDSNALSVGDLVLSAGAPFGFGHSVTMGTVSAARRDIVIHGRVYKGMIQTDAVINPGNSGGPLVDIRGRVVGINTAIYAPDGTYTGLGFAIPGNRAGQFLASVPGLVPAALRFPAVRPTHIFPIDITMGRPNDFNHFNFRDCTLCHTIQVKSPMAAGKQRPHPFVGACGKCHLLPQQQVATAPVKAAATPTAPPHNSWDFFRYVLFKAVPLLLISSIIFSMLGLGGGFFYVPILIMCNLDFHTATTTSLLMITAGSLSAVYVFMKSGMVDLKLVTALAGPAVVGSFAGGLMAGAFNLVVLYVLFSLTLFAAAFLMVQDKKIPAAQYYNLAASPLLMHREFNRASYTIDLLPAGFLVMVVGFQGGILGIAGGWFLVPMLVLLFDMPIRIAIATSAFMVPLNGIAGFTGHGVAGHIDWTLALPLCVLAAVGSQIGARISVKTDAGILRVIFAFMLGLVAVWMLTKNVLVF